MNTLFLFSVAASLSPFLMFVFELDRENRAKKNIERLRNIELLRVQGLISVWHAAQASKVQ